MNRKNLIKFPMTQMERIKNQRGKGYVPCMVSERWIQFPKESGSHFDDGEYIAISIMTYGSDDKDKKICDLVITREDILKAINSVKCPK